MSVFPSNASVGNKPQWCLLSPGLCHHESLFYMKILKYHVSPLNLLRSYLSGIAAAFLYLYETLSILNFPTLEKLWSKEFSCKMAALQVPAMDENA